MKSHIEFRLPDYREQRIPPAHVFIITSIGFYYTYLSMDNKLQALIKAGNTSPEAILIYINMVSAAFDQALKDPDLFLFFAAEYAEIITGILAPLLFTLQCKVLVRSHPIIKRTLKRLRKPVVSQPRGKVSPRTRKPGKSGTTTLNRKTQPSGKSRQK